MPCSNELERITAPRRGKPTYEVLVSNYVRNLKKEKPSGLRNGKSSDKTEKELLPMAYHKNTLSLEKMLLKFLAEPDPMLAMLEWLCHQLMEVEIENKLNAGKGEHSPERVGYRSGTRVRRFDTRMGTMYLLVPKVRKGGYVPFFVTERKRSEQALMQVVRKHLLTASQQEKLNGWPKALELN